MRRSHKNNRSPPRNLPAASRMHLSEEEIDEDAKRPQKHVVDPVGHWIGFLVCRLSHAWGRLGADSAIGVRVDGGLRLSNGRHGCLRNEDNARCRGRRERKICMWCCRGGRVLVVGGLSRVLDLGFVRSLALLSFRLTTVFTVRLWVRKRHSPPSGLVDFV